jgi:hypothetical protein
MSAERRRAQGDPAQPDNVELLERLLRRIALST